MQNADPHILILAAFKDNILKIIMMNSYLCYIQLYFSPFAK